MKKIKSKGFGTYHNDGLGKIDRYEISKDSLDEMRKTFKKSQKKLKESYEISIKRLEGFIKDEFRVIPSSDDFIEWFEENNLYKNWQGSGFVKIPEEDIFKATQQYLKQCKNKLALVKKNKVSLITDSKQKKGTPSIISEDASYNLDNLVYYFSEEIFSPVTRKEDIKKVFSYPVTKPIGDLILKTNNKVFVSLLLKMDKANILNTETLFSNIGILACFKSKRRTLLKKGNLEQAKHQLISTPLAIETDNYLDDLIKKIKKQ